MTQQGIERELLTTTFRHRDGNDITVRTYRAQTQSVVKYVTRIEHRDFWPVYSMRERIATFRGYKTEEAARRGHDQQLRRLARLFAQQATRAGGGLP